MTRPVPLVWDEWWWWLDPCLKVMLEKGMEAVAASCRHKDFPSDHGGKL